MEEMKGSPQPRAINYVATQRKKAEQSALTRMKVHCLFFTASLQECFTYVKAFFVGQAKMITARNEQEATEAEMQRAKMEVEATDAAEKTKKRLNRAL